MFYQLLGSQSLVLPNPEILIFTEFLIKTIFFAHINAQKKNGRVGKLILAILEVLSNFHDFSDIKWLVGATAFHCRSWSNLKKHVKDKK